MAVDNQPSRTSNKWVHPSVGLGLLVLLSNSASTYAATTSNLSRNLNATIEQTQMNGLLEDVIDADLTPTLAPSSYIELRPSVEGSYSPPSWLVEYFACDDRTFLAYNSSWGETAEYTAFDKQEYDQQKFFLFINELALGILRSTSGITSLISSSIFIWMIMRSHDRLSTTQHRLLLGLCISDIISSSSWPIFTANIIDGYMAARAPGCLVTFGAFGGLLYNASLNLYFLALVKYKKSEEFIRDKIEPFLHGIPIAVAFNYTLYYERYYGYSAIWDAHQWTDYWEGFKGGSEDNWNADIFQVVLMLIPAVIIMVSLGMIFSAVRTQEKKLAKYGVGALRSNLRQRSASTPQQRTVQDEQSSGMWGRISMSLSALSTSLKSRTWSCRKTNRPVTRSNNVQSQSRAVMHKAFGYTFAWFLSWGFYLIAKMTLEIPLVLVYIVYTCLPLQGFFNLLIFMYPKIMAAKKSKKRGETVSWRKAFSTAFWSKGKGGKNQGTSRSNLRGRSNRPLRNNRNENAVCGGVETPMFGGIKKTKKRRERAHQEEEEKCEIQVPDHLNPNMTRAMYSAASPAIYERNNVPPPSTETSTARTLNLSVDDDMVGMEKADVVENVNGGNALSDIAEDPYEDPMMSQDEEEAMNDVEKGNNETMPMAVADVNE